MPGQVDSRPPAKAHRAVALVAIIAALFGASLALPAPAQASPASDEIHMLNLTNQLRASVGVAPLTLDPTVSTVSRTWAGVMAATGGILHNPNRTTEITGWLKLGENVGMGGNIDVIHQALVESPGHYRNLVDPDFTIVGIGVVYSGNTVYVVQNFLKPVGGGDPEPVATAPEPAPDPAPTSSGERSRQADEIVPQEPAPPPAVAPPPPEPVAAPDPVGSVQAMQLNFVLEQLRALGLHP